MNLGGEKSFEMDMKKPSRFLVLLGIKGQTCHWFSTTFSLLSVGSLTCLIHPLNSGNLSFLSKVMLWLFMILPLIIETTYPAYHLIWVLIFFFQLP